MEKYGSTGKATGDNILRRVRFARCITKVADTRFFATAIMITRTRVNFTLYVHCLSCFELLSMHLDFLNVVQS